MAKSTFEWTFRDDEKQNLTSCCTLQSSHFSTQLDHEYKWVIILSKSKEELTNVDYVDLDLQLVESGTVEPVNAKYQLSLVNSVSRDRILFSIRGKYFFDNTSNKSVKLEKVIARDSLKAAIREDNLTLLCDLELNAGDDVLPSQNHKVENEICDLEYLLEDPEFSDFTLTTPRKTFKVHKIILCARSPVFAAILEPDMKKEKQIHTTEIPDMEDNTLKEMLRYIYCGKVKNMSQHACELLKAAYEYQLEGLKPMALETVLHSITVKNVADLYSLADRYSIEELKDATSRFITNNQKEILNGPNCYDYKHELLINIIRSINSMNLCDH